MLSKDELQIFCKTIGIDLSSDKQIYNGTVIYEISGGIGGLISKISHDIEISYEDSKSF